MAARQSRICMSRAGRKGPAAAQRAFSFLGRLLGAETLGWEWGSRAGKSLWRKLEVYDARGVRSGGIQAENGPVITDC